LRGGYFAAVLIVHRAFKTSRRLGTDLEGDNCREEDREQKKMQIVCFHVASPARRSAS
jgi:hypothetical protein